MSRIECYDVCVRAENGHSDLKNGEMWYLNIPFLRDAESLARGASTSANITRATIYTAFCCDWGNFESCTYVRGAVERRSFGWARHKRERKGKKNG
jgi:hypothetical protein